MLALSNDTVPTLSAYQRGTGGGGGVHDDGDGAAHVSQDLLPFHHDHPRLRLPANQHAKQHAS